MSEQQPVQASTTTQPRPTSGDYTEWKDYWRTAHNQQWRTEPEIDAERQHYLAARRAIKPSIEKLIYPFKDIQLSRADIEWLLATHESAGIRGPVDWGDPAQRGRDGLDIRGANLRGADLSSLPLARTKWGLTFDDVLLVGTLYANEGLTIKALLSHRFVVQAAAHAEEVNFLRSNLSGASLTSCHLERALLINVTLDEAALDGANLSGAALVGTQFGQSASMEGIVLSDDTGASAQVYGVNWGTADLSVVDWTRLKRIGDETVARQPANGPILKPKDKRLEEFGHAAVANRQLATALRAHGLNEYSDHFAYRAQLCQRQVLRRQGITKWPAYCGSLFLWALSGYGYRLWRIFATYIIVVLAFAAAYYFAGDWFHEPHLQPYEALLMSFTNIHGRAFTGVFDFKTVPVRAWLAGLQALFGLVIEGVFVAMLVQRFFAR